MPKDALWILSARLKSSITLNGPKQPGSPRLHEETLKNALGSRNHRYEYFIDSHKVEEKIARIMLKRKYLGKLKRKEDNFTRIKLLKIYIIRSIFKIILRSKNQTQNNLKIFSSKI